MGYRFDTLQVHAGQAPEGNTCASAVPIYQSAAFVFNDSGHAADLFAGRQTGNIYSRIGNPTTAVLERRLSALEDGIATVATSSGTTAIFYALLNLAGPGDEVIASQALYGGTTHLFQGIFKDMGIRVHLVDIRDRGHIEALFTERTRALFTETIGNPMNTVADLGMLSGIAHAHGVPLVVDSTVTTPYLMRPIEHGADIVVHSLTKFMGGHGLSIGGSVTDAGRFDWRDFPRLGGRDSVPDFSQDYGKAAYIERLRQVLLRDTGGCLSPFNAFTILMGIETLSLRMHKHCDNALALASFLKVHPRVAWVNYPGLAEHPDHDLARRCLPHGYGGIISFGPSGGPQAARKVVDGLRLFTHLANIGDTRSLIIHPASTTHQQLSDEQRHLSGIRPEMLRLSVGIEDIDDLREDLAQALEAL